MKGPLNCRSLHFASLRLTKGRVALPFRFDIVDDEQQVPPLRYAPVGMTLLFVTDKRTSRTRSGFGINASPLRGGRRLLLLRTILVWLARARRLGLALRGSRPRLANRFRIPREAPEGTAGWLRGWLRSG